MKWVNLFLALMFLGFAFLQLNDAPDDRIFWVALYGGIGIMSAFAAFNTYNMWVILLGIGAAVFQLFRIFPAFSIWINSGMPSIYGEMKPSSPHIELVREFFGLLFCLGILTYHYLRYRRLRKNEPVLAE